MKILRKRRALILIVIVIMFILLVILGFALGPDKTWKPPEGPTQTETR
jgi:hypothetical protein